MRDRSVVRERGMKKREKEEQTVTVQEMSNATCAQLSLRTDKTKGN